MARKLTTFSKLLITAAILAGLYFGGKYILNNTQLGSDIKEKADSASEDNNNVLSGKSDDDVLKVQLFTWGGYAPGLYFNNGWEASKNSRFYKEYGLLVEFVLIDDFNASRQAWKADEVNLIGQTADAFPTEVEGLADFDPQVVMQVDWSRGGDAIVARRGLNSINDLKGKKIAITPSTPSQTFLIKLLDAANLTVSEVELIETPDNFAAATAFKSREVDAAVVWAPDDELCVEAVPGSKILQSTSTASHVIADIFLAKKSYIEENRKKINDFYEGWMKGAAELNADEAKKLKAAEIMGKGTAYSTEDALFAINKARLVTHGDNLNFFNLNSGYKGVTGEDLYTEMGKRFADLGFAPAVRPRWQSVAYTGAAKAANLTGPMHEAESAPDFKPATTEDETAAAIASKPVSISFNSGQYTLTENAKTIIDIQFADLAKAFGNARVRIEGNTDNVGARAMNLNLSKKRAESVAKYLEQAYGMNPNKFVIVGNGPDKPVPGCETNSTEDCKAKNRRTEFQLIAG